MKRSGKILILLGIVIILMLGVIIMKMNNNAKETEDNSEKATVVYTMNSGMTSISWEYNGETVILDNSEKGLVLRGEESVSLNGVRTDAILKTLYDIEATRVIDEPEEPSEYGLDNPDMVITLTNGDSQDVIKVGMVNAITSERFISINDDGKVYIVTPDIYNAFLYVADDLIYVEEE